MKRIWKWWSRKPKMMSSSGVCIFMKSSENGNTTVSNDLYCFEPLQKWYFTQFLASNKFFLLEELVLNCSSCTKTSKGTQLGLGYSNIFCHFSVVKQCTVKLVYCIDSSHSPKFEPMFSRSDFSMTAASFCLRQSLHIKFAAQFSPFRYLQHYPHQLFHDATAWTDTQKQIYIRSYTHPRTPSWYAFATYCYHNPKTHRIWRRQMGNFNIARWRSRLLRSAKLGKLLQSSSYVIFFIHSKDMLSLSKCIATFLFFLSLIRRTFMF